MNFIKHSNIVDKLVLYLTRGPQQAIRFANYTRLSAIDCSCRLPKT